MISYIFVMVCFGMVMAALDNMAKRIKNIEANIDSFLDEDVRKAIVESWLKDCE